MPGAAAVLTCIAHLGCLSVSMPEQPRRARHVLAAQSRTSWPRDISTLPNASLVEPMDFSRHRPRAGRQARTSPGRALLRDQSALNDGAVVRRAELRHAGLAEGRPSCRDFRLDGARHLSSGPKGRAASRRAGFRSCRAPRSTLFGSDAEPHRRPGGAGWRVARAMRANTEEAQTRNTSAGGVRPPGRPVLHRRRPLLLGSLAPCRRAPRPCRQHQVSRRPRLMAPDQSPARHAARMLPAASRRCTTTATSARR